MYRVIQKCKKCKGPISESYLSDFDKVQENYTQFFITYCPYCVKLGDVIPAMIWAHTVKKLKLPKPKPEPKFKVSRSKKRKKK